MVGMIYPNGILRWKMNQHFFSAYFKIVFQRKLAVPKVGATVFYGTATEYFLSRSSQFHTVDTMGNAVEKRPKETSVQRGWR